MPQFTYRSVSFYYTDTGSGPAVVFLHGFLENQSMWHRLAGDLPKKYRKITLDLPGHGQSGNLGYIHTMEGMAEVVRALTDHLKLRKISLAGHSMGGYVALAFAERYPDMIRGLILMNSTAYADSPPKKTDRDRAIALVKQNPKSFIRQSIPHLFRPKNRALYRPEINALKQQALLTSKQGIVAALEGMKVRPDREVLLHFGPYPVLFIAARHDPVIPFSLSAPQLDAERVRPCITENGHMAHIEDYETVYGAFKEFLNAFSS